MNDPTSILDRSTTTDSRSRAPMQAGFTGRVSHPSRRGPSLRGASLRRRNRSDDESVTASANRDVRAGHQRPNRNSDDLHQAMTT